MTGIGKREPFKNIPEHSVHNEDHFQKKLFYDNLTCWHFYQSLIYLEERKYPIKPVLVFYMEKEKYAISAFSIHFAAPKAKCLMKHW
jgi:hypothetical protein